MESVLHKDLQLLNRHEWLVLHYSAVSTQYHNIYRLVAVLLSQLGLFRLKSRSEFWKQTLECSDAFQVFRVLEFTA